MKTVLATGLAGVLVLATPVRADTPLEIVASILPVHSLVSAVTGDVVAPALVLPGTASPHFHQLRPSQARALHRADVVFWIGPEMETVLARSIAGLAPETTVISLIDSPGLHLLSNRVDADWLTQVSGTGDADGHDETAAARHTLDPHIWLSPENARHMVRNIAQILSRLDQANQSRYRRNAEITLTRIAVLDQDMTTGLGRVRKNPYVVFHDAFAYLEDHYQLSALGAITVNPDRPPSAKRIAALQKTIREHGVECVFVEPQFSAAWMKALSADHHTRVGVLDPVGAGLQPGPEAYFTLMASNASALIDCLGQ